MIVEQNHKLCICNITACTDSRYICPCKCASHTNCRHNYIIERAPQQTVSFLALSKRLFLSNILEIEHECLNRVGADKYSGQIGLQEPNVRLHVPECLSRGLIVSPLPRSFDSRLVLSIVALVNSFDTRSGSFDSRPGSFDSRPG